MGKIERRDADYTFWDLGGQKVLRKIWSKYYRDASAVFFVVDGTDPLRFAEATQCLQSLYDPEGEDFDLLH